MRIQLRRVYESPGMNNGYRVLVDRVWPRGVSKEAARVDAWNKDVAPSTRLRQWFGHDPGKWGEFKKRYWQELHANCAGVAPLLERARAEYAEGCGGGPALINMSAPIDQWDWDVVDQFLASIE